ncbi:response regulator transcription factor [Kineosporia succinea]|uniref:DNA-binding NarL/FixJ family response regulator n=1 Tax=Kineosporia succinea TaxID=84632 RepID=A0ABT9NX65_9ACTN|nr:response regulator transcription factor [Kineosporia succinea]MDP9824595.1 DNA-binding NarL/FixJ family response regulator [Kineosporia succinea]
MTIRLLLADDQELVRLGLRMVLGTFDDLDVVGEAADGEQAVTETRRLVPDVVLMDIRMPGTDGITATARITETRPGTRVLVLTTFEEDEYVFGALRAGAAGFLLKDASRDKLVEAIRVVHQGDSLLSPAVTRRLIEVFSRRPQPVPVSTATERLTARERETLVQVARGRSNAEIGVILHVTEATVKTHVSSVLLKLGLRDRVQAVVFAYENGLVVAGQDD